MKKIYLSIIALILILMLSLFLSKCNPEEQRIDIAITALSNMVKKDGHIIYKIDFLDNKTSKKNNLVREMGSAYALAFAYHQTHSNKLKQKLIKILNRIEDTCEDITSDSCIIMKEEEKVKIGATALALLAELYFEKTSKVDKFFSLREKLVNTLINSYMPGKGVRNNPNTEDTSPYFDGETWFSLSVYHSMYPDNEKVSKVLPLLDDTMMKIYGEKYLISFVHWGMMAASQRYNTTNDSKFLEFLKKQFMLYVEENPEPRRGSSTCSVTEGLADIVYHVGTNDYDFSKAVFDRIEKNKVAIYNLQLLSELLDSTKTKIHPKTERYLGAFLNTPGNYKTRNDITQHCLTALLKRKRCAEF